MIGTNATNPMFLVDFFVSVPLSRQKRTLFVDDFSVEIGSQIGKLFSETFNF